MSTADMAREGLAGVQPLFNRYLKEVIDILEVTGHHTHRGWPASEVLEVLSIAGESLSGLFGAWRTGYSLVNHVR